MGANVGQVGVGGAQVVYQVRDGDPQRFAAGFLDAALQLPPPAGEVVHHLVQAFAQSLDVLFQFALTGFGQLPELIRRHGRFVVLHRHEGKAVGRAHQGHAERPRLPAEGLQLGFFTLLFFFLHGFEATAVFVALKNRADGGNQLLDEVLHVALQACAAAAGQAQQLRTVGVDEVVDVAPVGRRLAAHALVLQQLTDDGVAAAARFTEQEEVVTFVMDVEAQMYRLNGPPVNHRSVQVGEGVGAGEGEFRRIAGGVQCLGRKGRRRAHRTDLG